MPSGSVHADFTINGLDALEKALGDLPRVLQEEILAEALQAGGEVIQQGAVRRIHSKTGRTAAGIVVAVQQSQALFGKAGGAVAIGPDFKNQYKVRFLEFGTKPHPIEAGKSERKRTAHLLKLLTKSGGRASAEALRKRVTQDKVIKRALVLPGGKFRSKVNHPGTRPQSPLTLALAEDGTRAVAAFRDVAWAGIAKFAEARNASTSVL